MKKSRPTANAAQILTFIGGTIILLIGLLAFLGIPLDLTLMSGHVMVYPIYSMNIYIGAIGVISGAVVMLAAFLSRNRSSGELQYWYAVALVFAVIALIGGGGLLVGSLLAFIGSIFGISNRTGALPAVRAVQQTRSAQRTPNAREQARVVSGLKAEEKKLYGIAASSGGAIFQAELVEKSGFSKVKVSRILDRLEGHGILERRRRGMTNMVVLKNSDGAGSQ